MEGKVCVVLWMKDQGLRLEPPPLCRFPKTSPFPVSHLLIEFSDCFRDMLECD